MGQRLEQSALLQQASAHPGHVPAVGSDDLGDDAAVPLLAVDLVDVQRGASAQEVDHLVTGQQLFSRRQRVGDLAGHGPAAAFAGVVNRTCTVAVPDTAGRDTR
jgi:hypothetical protein